MGKEDKFINPQKAIVIKLGSRDLADPNRNKGNKDRPTYEIVSFPNDERLSEEEIQKRNRILGIFDESDQGKFDYKEPEGGSGFSHKAQALKLAQGQEGLWINTLQKIKQGSLQEEILAGGEYDDVEYEEEELEDIEEGEDYEYDEDEEDEDEQEDEEEQKEQTGNSDGEEEQKEGEENKQKKEKEQKEKAVLEGKRHQKIFDDFQKTYIIEKKDGDVVKRIEINPDKIYDIDDIDYSKIKINQNIKMKKLNKYGLPADDGYDYSQHVFSDSVEPEGKLVATFTNKQEFAPKLEPDYDYLPEEMGKEQTEVFESLNQDDIYEDLEDDFVALAQDGEDCIENLEENYNEQKQKKKPVKGGAKKLKQKQQQIKNQVKQTKPIEEKDENEQEDDEQNQGQEDDDLMADEEFDEEEFRKAMDMYEECEDESKVKQKNQTEIIQGKELECILDSHLEEIKVREQKKKPQNDIKQVQFEFYGNKAEEEAYEEFEDQQLDDHVPEIIRKMKERLDQQERERNGDQQEKPKPLYQYNVKRRQKEEREVKRCDKIAMRKAEIEKFGDIVVDRQTVKPLEYQKDIALQNYLARTEEEEEKIQEEEDKRFEKLLQPRALDVTIATKTFAESRVHENLNVVAEMSRKEINKSIRQSQLLEQSQLEKNKNSQKSEIEEQDDEDESEMGDGRIRDVSSIFQKRGKNETKEERKLRKELVKQFKQQRKENKKNFKDNFENLAKVQNDKITKQVQTQNNLRGVAVKKL